MQYHLDPSAQLVCPQLHQALDDTVDRYRKPEKTEWLLPTVEAVYYQ